MMYQVNAGNRLVLTADSWKTIQKVNTEGNTVIWADDMENWGEDDRWEFPKDVGNRTYEDCDGITLYKMQLLLKAGFPAAPLLFTICNDENGEGHAVLCIATDRGDFILDNRFDIPESYDTLKKYGYEFLYRSRIGGKINGQWSKIV